MVKDCLLLWVLAVQVVSELHMHVLPCLCFHWTYHVLASSLPSLLCVSVCDNGHRDLEGLKLRIDSTLLQRSADGTAVILQHV